MRLEAQIKNLELRLQMAIAHVVQAQADLDVVRGKAGLPPARPVFFLTPQGTPPDEETGDNGVAGARARRAAKAPSSAAAAPETGSAGVRALIEMYAREREAAAPPAIDPVATAAAIHRAAALARGEIVELPAPGSAARQILEAGAKAKSQTLEGKPL